MDLMSWQYIVYNIVHPLLADPLGILSIACVSVRAPSGVYTAASTRWSVVRLSSAPPIEPHGTNQSASASAYKNCPVGVLPNQLDAGMHAQYSGLVVQSQGRVVARFCALGSPAEP